MATIVDFSSKYEGCGYLIVIEGERDLYEAPEIPMEFQKDGMNVWIDYALSRRKQGTCMQAIPIIINQIKVREK